MFIMESRLTFTESVVELADSAVELATDPMKIGLWVLALSLDYVGQFESCTRQGSG